MVSEIVEIDGGSGISEGLREGPIPAPVRVRNGPCESRNRLQVSIAKVLMGQPTLSSSVVTSINFTS
jgi:hypothetical protein